MPKKTLGVLGGDRGNTQNPIPSTEKSTEKQTSKQVPKRKNHFFTWNNYTEDQIGGILEYFNRNALKYAFQEEICPTTGTPHLQGMVMFQNECRSTVWDPTSKGHWEPLKKTDAVYQLKEASRKPNGRQWTKGLPKPLKLITPNFWWQKDILNLIKTEANDRNIHWYWSEAGSVGKSQFAKYLVVEKNAVFCSKGEYADICYTIMESNIEESGLVVINLPRKTENKICYEALECLIDGLIYSPKYESKYKVFNSPHIIIFSNAPPKIENMSEDRFIITQIDSQEGYLREMLMNFEYSDK